KKSDKSWLNRKLFHEHLVVLEDERFKLLLDPIIDFRLNSNDLPETGYLNTRGILLSGNLDSKIYFNTSFYENQGVFPMQIYDFYDFYGVIPGYGRIKPLSRINEYDFATTYGNVSFRATENLNFSLGYDRLFIGDGYRSMILSDHAAPMMYFKTSVKFGKFEYNNIFTKALNPNFNNVMGFAVPTSMNTRYPSKYISYNTLTYKLNDWQFSLIEALVMSDDLPNWKVPVYTFSPFFRTAYIDYKKQLTNNLVGANITWHNPKNGIFYSQFILDSWYKDWSPRLAFQLGYKDFDFLNLDNLYFQLEINYASHRAYAHANNELYYGHYNQALAHPAGAHITEFVLLSAYSIKKFELVAKMNYYFECTDSYISSNQNINGPYISYREYLSGDFLKAEAQFIYNINRANRLQAFCSWDVIYQINNNKTLMFYQIGIRTAIRSNYYDF
ncbi:MAG: hypothetical protein PHW82_05205, partial [Bacteroidales bacterium]|nr:hypothetical protein [Bacteroidales bacterium]